jgi:hypothetical protein
MSEQQRDPRELWAEVGHRFGELGQAVSSHLEPESPDSATWTPPPEGAADRRDDQWADRRDDQWADRWDDARDTVRRLGRSAQRLTTQAGEAARDPVVRETAQAAARMLGAAVTRTAEEVAAHLRESLRSPRWSDESRPRPTSPPVAPIRTDDEPS